VIPTAFDYERAASLDEALAKLQAANGSGKVVAGGHSLLPLMKLRLSEPQRLIDIARIPELRGICESDGRVVIGAATTHHEVATSALLRQRCAALAEAASTIGDQQVRNRGTIGGSLAHADPSADYPAMMLALDGDLELAGPNGRRVVKADAFFRDLFTVDLAPDEIIVAVHVPPAQHAAYAKLYQRASHYAIVGVAAALEVEGHTIRSARVGLTGASACARRLSNVELALAGRPATVDSVRAAAALAAESVQDVSEDVHASAEYRRAMIPVFARRALEAALARRHA
jgi:aerobic carbon-monoxide dehydrogenase medium subunit